MTPDNAKKNVFLHWDLINKLAAKRFQMQTTAEEAALFVMEELQKNDWQRVCRYREQSRFTTFLATLTYRLLEDFSRKKFGRKRPQKWIRELGGVWLYLYRLLCLERFSFSDATEMAVLTFRQFSRKNLEKKIEKILWEVADCRKIQGETPLTNKEEEALSTKQPEKLEQKQEQLLLEALQLELFGTNDRQTGATLTKFRDKISLKTDEQLLLKLRHQEQLSIAEMGRMMNRNRFQLHAKFRRIYQKVRRQLGEAGLEQELKLLLEK